MRGLTSLFPALLGMLVILQAGINRKIASEWGLPVAVLMNSLILTAVAIGFFVFCRLRGDYLPVEFSAHFESNRFLPWFILPGLIGFILVFGGPWAIARWGAAYTFVLMISAQIGTSALWDYFAENQTPSKLKLLGMIITWIGALLVSKAS